MVLEVLSSDSEQESGDLPTGAHVKIVEHVLGHLGALGLALLSVEFSACLKDRRG